MRVFYTNKPPGAVEHLPSKRLHQKIWRKRVRAELLKRDGPCCFYCDYRFTEEYPPTIEHLLPKSAGGQNNIANIVLACFDCNQKVGRWPLIRKIKYREFRIITKI